MRWLFLALALLLPATARAADPAWPTRPLVMVVAYPPGAITDTVGRRVAERLGAALGQNVVVENRGGAGGNVAAAHVARQRGDSHTLLFTSYGNLIIAAAADLRLEFHPFRDLAPVAMTDLLGGRVDATLATVLFARPYMADNRVRAIAIGNAERSPVLPEIPAVAEAIPGAALTDGLAVMAPPALPATITARLNTALNAIISEPVMRDWLTNEGVTPRPGPPEALTAEMQDAADGLRRLLVEAKIKLE
jgi:tripartite-type tricarboxylate transporter receptor subunit TctC